MSLITPELGLLVWMTLIFGIVFFILAKFGFPVITGMVDKRARHIEQALEDARKAKEELDGMQDRCRQMLEQTRAEQEVMLEKARKGSAQMIQEAKEQAKKEAGQVLALAREQIEVEKREALNDVRNTVVDLALAVSEKILGQRLQNDKAQMEYIDKVLSEAEKEIRG